MVTRTRTNRADYSKNGHWIFDEPLDKRNAGFIYMIRDIELGKGYIGKKQFVGAGKLNRGVESNWMWYTSSCKDLVAAIKKRGKDNFEYLVLEQYKTKGALSYAETWTLMAAETPTNRHIWYNLLVNKVSWNVKEAITARHKERLRKAMAHEPFVMQFDLEDV